MKQYFINNIVKNIYYYFFVLNVIFNSIFFKYFNIKNMF